MMSAPLFFRKCSEGLEDQLRGRPETPGVSSLTEKMHELSHQEREQGLFDLHGVSDIVKETDELIERKLAELDSELAMISNISALNLARAKSPEYVTRLRLIFLRADQFNAQHAAQRMAHFFEMKHSIFGEAKLVEDITWCDLSESDKDALQEGSIQLLPQRDRAGRAVIFRIGVLCYGQSVETQIRIFYFIIMKALEDEEVQKHGMVIVGYNVEQSKYVGETVYRTLSALESLPVRVPASHYCYNLPFLGPVVNMLQYAMKKNGLCRFRAHQGSHMECQYNLMTFGIQKHVIPISPTGEVYLTFHHHWLKLMQEDTMPESQKSSGNSTILVPGHMDVIVGRGRDVELSGGNVRFRHLLETNSPIYDAASIVERKAINWNLLKELKASGSRIIKREGNGWIEITDDVAIDKISHGFRNLRKKTRCKQAEHQSKDSSISKPGKLDVVLGRGRHGQFSEGNRRFKEILKTHHHTYDISSIIERKELNKKVLQEVKGAGIRFIKKDGDAWIEISEDAAIDKISHAFRNLRPDVDSSNANKNKKPRT